MDEFSGRVGKKAQRRLKARRTRGQDIWFGLGMFGIIGWSVAIPIIAGIAAGVWIDQRWPSRFSWTLMLLALGALLGCLNAWHWVRREREEIEQNEEERRTDRK